MDVLAEDPEHIDIDNDSTHSSDGTFALGGPEALGYPEDSVYDNKDRLTALTREINDLCQRVAAGEGQPAETPDCIQHELQNLLIAIHQLHPPAPTKLSEKYYSNTQAPHVPHRNSPTSQTPYCKLYLFLLGVVLLS